MRLSGFLVRLIDSYALIRLMIFARMHAASADQVAFSNCQYLKLKLSASSSIFYIVHIAQGKSPVVLIPAKLFNAFHFCRHRRGDGFCHGHYYDGLPILFQLAELSAAHRTSRRKEELKR